MPRFVRTAAAVCAWEVRSFFLRPASYALLLAAALLAGWSFSWLVTLLSQGTNAALRAADNPVAQYLGPNLFVIAGCTLLIPLLTMNSIADERRRSSWELLVTAPISPLAVVCGKFAAAWLVFLTCLAPWLYHLVVLRGWNGRLKVLGNFIPWFEGPGLAFDMGPSWGGFIGLAVTGATFVALGIFCSGLCRRPASAALLSLFVMGTILAAGFVPRILPYWGFASAQIEAAQTISLWGQVERFSRGVIEPRVIAGHVSICATLLWGTAYISRRVDEA